MNRHEQLARILAERARRSLRGWSSIPQRTDDLDAELAGEFRQAREAAERPTPARVAAA